VVKSLKTQAPAIAWGIFIFILSTIPGNELPRIPKLIDIIALDKIVHMIFYAVLTWLILRKYPLSWKAVILIVVMCSGFGWFIEWFQGTFSQGRQFEFLDGVANTIGAFLIGTVFIILNKKKKQSVRT
jgi:VanZ family protein